MEYTYFNLCLFILTFFNRDRKFTEFVRASSSIVFLGWVLVIVFYGYGAVARFYRGHFKSPKMSIETIVLLDFFAHVLPFMVLQLPQDPAMFFVASVVVVSWYIVVRTRIHKMYYLPYDHLVYRDAIVFSGAIGLNVIMWVLKGK